MRKAFVLFAVLLVGSFATLFVLPGQVRKEADNVQYEVEIFEGTPDLVEDVTVTVHNHWNGRLFWDTVYRAGEEPFVNTAHRVSWKKEKTDSYHREDLWWSEAGGYDCMRMYNGLSGGWSVSSSGSLSTATGNAELKGLSVAFEELAAEVKPGETGTKQIFLNDYMEYFPIQFTIELPGTFGGVYHTVEAEKLYEEFFRIPVPKDARYTISVKKNEIGGITHMEGIDPDQAIYSWNTVSVCTDREIFFTFHRYSADGTRRNTELIPGGFGVYRQPYAIGVEGLFVDAKQLEMVYSLEEETYPYGSLFLDVNEGGQLVIIIDREQGTHLTVVDTATMERVQEIEFKRPEGKNQFLSVARVAEDFILISYGEYYALIERREEAGYAHRFTFAVTEDDPLYRFGWINENAMDWNGEQLVYVTCTDGNVMQGRSNFELAVYDKTGRVFHGKYNSSLLTEQENAPYAFSKYGMCQPRTSVCIDVKWKK